MRRPTRRSILAFGASSSVALVFAGRCSALAARAARALTGADSRDALESFFSRPAAARRVGLAYLEATPVEDDVDTLRALLVPPGEPDTWWQTVSEPALSREIRRRAHDDFRQGDVVYVISWELARSEARLAALWARTHA